MFIIEITISIVIEFVIIFILFQSLLFTSITNSYLYN